MKVFGQESTVAMQNRANL